MGAGAAIAAGSVAAAGIGAVSSMSAAGQASKSANAASALQAKQQATTRGDLAPYNAVGQSAAGQLADQNANNWGLGSQPNYLDMAAGAVPGTMTQSQLEATPGYQFQLGQGLQSTQSAAAARGLGVSGAALKGAATYATGLANSNYQQQFANQQQKYADYLNLNTGQQTNVQNQYTRLSGTATLGENAAATTGQQGTQAASTGGNYLNQAGQATAAGTTGIGNAVTGNVNSGFNNYLAYQGMQNGMTGGYGSGGATKAAATGASGWGDPTGGAWA